MTKYTDGVAAANRGVMEATIANLRAQVLAETARRADETQEVVATLYKAWPHAEDIASDWPLGIIGSIEQIIAERDDARKSVPAYNEQELDNLIAEGWSRDHAEWAAHLSRRLTESMMECSGLSGRLTALSEAAAMALAALGPLKTCWDAGGTEAIGLTGRLHAAKRLLTVADFRHASEAHQALSEALEKE